MTSLRIALVHPFCWPEVRRGGERYLGDLTTYLVSAGHQVTVITGTDNEPRRGVEDGATFIRERLPRSVRLAAVGLGAAELFALPALRELLEERDRVDLVHALMPSSALAARAARVPTIFTLIGHPSPALVARRPIIRALMAGAVRLSTRVTALSEASAAAAAASFGRRPIPLAPGVRLEQFPVRTGPATGPVRVLFSGDCGQPQKGLDVLVRAMPHVLREVPDARLVISGPGDPSWALKLVESPAPDTFADVLGVGRLEDVPARYRDATITVLPSRDEAFGLVLVESLATGTPVVSSDQGGMPEIVNDDGVGRVARYGDAQALARAVIEAVRLARDPATPARCRARAEAYGWSEVVGPAHESLYRAAIGPRARTGVS